MKSEAVIPLAEVEAAVVVEMKKMVKLVVKAFYASCNNVPQAE